MILKNLVPSKVPVVPDELKDKFEIFTAYALNENEAKYFSLALQAIVKQLNCEHKKYSDLMGITAVITEEGSLLLQMEDESIGNQFCLAVYAVKRWRNLKFEESQIITIILEELCHQYWNIEDETEVQYKVYDVLKWIFPNTKIEQFYNM
ncbi:hypothetical protein [Clostridium tyrobutyricum]|uniref:hypothetical protein n=1 Tax=Clostridium tyrobutyricum TaxID=1519 RepID=UPI0011CB43D6|nr:hypothetical protein [Clostridium tyrobutyricum]